MPALAMPADDEVTLTQMAESYRSLAHAGVHLIADQTAALKRSERTLDSLRERLAERDARIAQLEAEISRFTRSQVARSEAA